ncbi:hypothetical protein EJ04DRAFT_527418 [Polyplosphaeria fusca]|uniref:Uncharacterized protein n=1 Tax=Polyplosphaeria fusca TaxID=682080 RepID=A0A9P4UVE3_9PLEO|nr:hypothetical protein EJ04DRAFT_527418 [Polyplosphaeria fusca]
MYQNSNPFLCPIAHMIAVGLHHDAFAASTIRDPEAILRARIPKRKTCRIFRWKESKLKEPIFREPQRAKGQASLASPVMPLRAHTVARYLKRLGRDVGMEQPLSHTCIRRGTGNAVDKMGTVADRDQVMGHSYSGIFQFYINPNVKCDVQTAYLEQPSDTALMKVLSSMSLTRYPLAPNKLSLDDARAIEQHATIVKLRQKRDALTKTIGEIRREARPERRRGSAASEKKHLRDRAERKARERYFMENDTRELEQEDEDEVKPAVTTCALEGGLASQRMFCWSRPAKMMDHLEDHHLGYFAQDATISCPHPTCRRKGAMLDGVSHFKNHALCVHNIKLRVPRVEPF